jgi:hypothetical protein
MAVSAAARQLTARHRQTQQAVRAAAARDTMSVWAAFDLEDIDGSWAAIEPAMLAVTYDYRRQSAHLAGGYYQAFRTVEGPAGTWQPQMPVPPSREVMRYSLGYYGRVVPNQLWRTGTTGVAAKTLVQLVGGVTRHVLDGGRDTIVDNFRADRAAQGWRRVTDSRPCSFCAMLAARGAVYQETTVGFEAHDHCACAAEPVFTRSDVRTDAERGWQRLWNDSTRGLSGPDARNAFRRAYEAA